MTSTSGTSHSMHRRFNEADELENIERRYAAVSLIPNQIKLLRNDKKFQAFYKELRAEGFKDWLVLSVIQNIVLNLRFRQNGGDYRNPEQMKLLFLDRRDHIINDVYPVDHFVGPNFKQTFYSFCCAVLQGWGFEIRVQVIRPNLIERFLRNRTRFFDLDVPHDTFFDPDE